MKNIDLDELADKDGSNDQEQFKVRVNEKLRS